MLSFLIQKLIINTRDLSSTSVFLNTKIKILSIFVLFSCILRDWNLSLKHHSYDCNLLFDLNFKSESVSKACWYI